MAELDYFGVHPECGCISAWMSGAHSTKKDVRDFYKDMAESGRDVRRMEFTEEIRGQINPCSHKDGVHPAQEARNVAP